MPTDLTPAPFRAEQQFPYGLSHPTFYAGHAPASSGPARLSACLAPAPGDVMPNGVRNPYAPWGGETYVPAHAHAPASYGHMHDSPGFSLRPRAGFGAAHAPAPSAYAASHASYASRASGGSFGARAVPIPSFTEDGWGASAHGRRHDAHAPDLVAGVAAGAGVGAGGLSRSTGAWLPASSVTHAPLSAPRRIPTLLADESPLDPARLRPPSAHGPAASACAAHQYVGGSRHRAASTSSAAPHRAPSPAHKRYGSSPVFESPLRRALAPDPGAGAPLVRKASRGSSGRCSQCSQH
ncbi:hypothetical protein Q5752_005315 [Cryptotrichosporon argae]